MLAKPSLTLKRRLAAAPAKIFQAWTDPQKLILWFGPADAEQGSLRAQLDVRVGGSFCIDFSTRDGEAHQVSGTYREVVLDQRLVFTWAWVTTPERQSLVAVTLSPEGAGTLLTLHHEQFFDDKARDGHERGWTGTLTKLASYLSN